MPPVALERRTTLPFTARGPLSAGLLDALRGGDTPVAALPDLAAEAVTEVDAIRDDDVQLALFTLYAIAYGSLPELDAMWEWDLDLLRTRAILERAFEDELRLVVEPPETPEPTAEAVAARLFEFTAPTPGPSLSRYLAKKATREQALEFLAQRSVYTLREADAHSWTIPRLTGRAKAALLEIQSDEYGGGRPERMHQTIYAQTLRGAGLDDRYGTYVDHVPAITLASFNLMTMFGMHRRLRGASVGHLAAYEMTSSIPCRFYGDGLRRLGFGEDVTRYYDEHVAADAVHEQIAARDLAGSLAEDEPELLADILFGAAASFTVDGWAADDMLAAFERGESSLRRPLESA